MLCFRIYSFNVKGGEADVHHSIEALRIAFFECLAISTKLLKFYMMHPPLDVGKLAGIRMRVATEAQTSFKAAGVGAPHKTEMIAEMVPLANADGTLERERVESIWSINRRVQSLATSKCLRNIVYRHGRIQIRALLGEFVFTRYLTGSASRVSSVDVHVPILDFIDNLRNPKTEGAIYRL